MTRAALTSRSLEPGTTGWTVDDFADPEVQRHLGDMRCEIVDGVLTMMAPQGYHVIGPLSVLRDLLTDHFRAVGMRGRFFHEVDVRVRRNRVARPDMIYLTQEQIARQSELETEKALRAEDYTPILVPPMLIVESISPRHEDHDRITKREWYAELGVSNYWLLCNHERSLVCLRLEGDAYVEAAAGNGDAVLTANLRGDVRIPLSQLW